MSSVRQTVGARLDLVGIVAYLAERSEGAARRFRVRAEATFERLARAPGIGGRYRPDEPAYADVRHATIDGFQSYIVFYRPLPDGIEAIRVLHGARDLGALLAEEFGAGGEEGDVP